MSDRTTEPLTPDRPGPESGADLVTEQPIAKANEKSVQLTVAEGTQINHDGRVYAAGESFSAPESLAEAWISYGWAVAATFRAKTPAGRRRRA